MGRPWNGRFIPRSIALALMRSPSRTFIPPTQLFSPSPNGNFALSLCKARSSAMASRLYPEAQLITTPARGSSLLKVIGDKRAALLRGHGIVVVGQNLQEVLYTSLVLEDDTKKTLQAVTLGEIGTISPEECRAFGAEIALERRAQRAWNYFCSLEARWDRQPNTGKCELFP